ncbi:unnamed protein product [Cochlearia groenlandica]
MDNGTGQYANPDHFKGWNMLPHHQIKEQHNALVMNKKIMSILAERDSALHERNKALSSAKEALAARDQALRQRDKAISERDKALIERDNAYAALQLHENSLNFALSRNGNKPSHDNNDDHNVDDDGIYISIGENNNLEVFPIPTIPTETKTKTNKRKKKVSLQANASSLGKKSRKDCDSSNNVLSFDESTMQIPVCSCTGSSRQCYKWGSGGWQSSCCTTTLSEYPLPQMPNKRHSRMSGRKMSGNVFSRLLSRLAAEGYDLTGPVDLKDYWARHGTNRYITIK